MPTTVARKRLTTETAPTTTVDLYARLSRNPSGDLEKIDDQLDDARAAAERWGLAVGAVHVDNSLSAWKGGVRRPGWEALLDRLERGETGGVIVWHLDRLFRQPRDLERLLDLADRGVRLASVHGARDLADADDRFILRIEVAHACRSSDDTSRRLRRRFQARREDGHVHGGARPFGFPGPDRQTGDPVAAEQVQRERAAMVRAAEEITAGLPLGSIARRWNDDGLTTATGGAWNSTSLRAVLTRGRNAGLVEHDGVTVGRTEDAIYSEDQHARVMAVFTSRRRGRPNSGRYLASGLVHCAACGRRMGGRPAGTYRDGSTRTQYVCQKAAGGCGTVAADGRGLDAVLQAFALERLSNREHAAALNSRIAAAVERREEIAADLYRARETSAALGERLGRGEIELEVFDSAMRPLRERVAALESERDALPADDAPEVPEADRNALAARWENGSTEDRRALLSTALRGFRATVAPASKRGAFDPDRVSITPLA